MSDETTAGKRFALLPRSYSFSMSGTFGDVELESEVILEDNITLNRIMAEPQGTAVGSSNDERSPQASPSPSVGSDRLHRSG